MSDATQDIPKDSRSYRLWRWLKVTVLVALLPVGVVLIWFAVANWRAGSRLHATVAEIQAKGMSITLAELERSPPPLPENNADTFLRRAAAGVEVIEKAVSAAEEKLSPEESKAYDSQNRTTPELQAALQQAFAENPDTIPLLLKAAAAPDYDPQFDFRLPPAEFVETYLSRPQPVRQPLRVLSYYVAMLVNEGKQAEALNVCIAMLSLCRHFDSRPLLVGYLVNLAARGIAIRATDAVLQSGPLPAESLKRLQAELARQDPSAALRFSLRTEHAFATQALREMPAAAWYLRTPLGKNDLADHHQLLAGVDERIGSTYAEVIDWLNAQQLGMLAHAMIPAIQASLSANARIQAQLNALQVIAALPQSPASDVTTPPLNGLGLSSAATLDPYNGKQLLVRREPGGWLVYAVGPNLKDDGGRIHERHGGDFLDVGLGPPEPGD